MKEIRKLRNEFVKATKDLYFTSLNTKDETVKEQLSDSSLQINFYERLVQSLCDKLGKEYVLLVAQDIEVGLTEDEEKEENEDEERKDPVQSAIEKELGEGPYFNRYGFKVTKTKRRKSRNKSSD